MLFLWVLKRVLWTMKSVLIAICIELWVQVSAVSSGFDYMHLAGLMIL
jgi:hypothetical protein